MDYDRRKRYIEGNTVRKAEPLRRPKRQEEPRRQAKRRRAPREKIQYVNVLYAIFVVTATCMLLWSCVNYLQLQAETTSRMKNIAALEMKLEELKKENDDNYTRIMTSVDLEYIKDVAINELGMVYAGEDQVILYDGKTRDYVRQNQEIPKEEKTLIDQILGNDR